MVPYDDMISVKQPNKYALPYTAHNILTSLALENIIFWGNNFALTTISILELKFKMSHCISLSFNYSY